VYLALLLALVAFLAPFSLSFFPLDLFFLLFVFFFLVWMDDCAVVFAITIYDHPNLYEFMRLCMYVDAVYNMCVCVFLPTSNGQLREG
jgi:hypothetical protein